MAPLPLSRIHNASYSACVQKRVRYLVVMGVTVHHLPERGGSIVNKALFLCRCEAKTFASVKYLLGPLMHGVPLLCM